MAVSRDDIRSVAALADPVRRRIYEFASHAPSPVSRDETVAALGVGRSLAAFHLDRLVRDGLLEAQFRRLTGRTGPGAGRPAKLYRRSAMDIRVHLPERRYELAASILVEATEAVGPAGAEAVRTAARRAGAMIAAEAAAETIVERLAGLGFEPVVDARGEVRLRNCPFRALVPDHRDTTCEMNLAFVNGLMEGVGSGGIKARLDPREEGCCVALATAADGTA